MHPILFQLGRFTVYTYGLLVALAFLAAFWLTGREAERRGLDRRDFQDMGFLVIVAALVGSRVFYVLVEWEYFLGHPLEVVKIWEGGLVFYGGFICAALAMVWHVRARGLPVWTTCDVLAPALALGQTLGRVGCFFAGCCYGAECALPWAITFTDQRGLAPVDTPVHPTQLYSAAANLSILAILYFVVRPRQRFEGQLLGVYLVLYPAARFLIEFFRADPRGVLGPLSTSQALGIPLLLFGIWILIRRKPAT